MRYGIGDVVMQTPAVELLAQDPAVDEIVDVKRMWGLTHWYDAGEGRMEALD
jgi:hypothetical protein